MGVTPRRIRVALCAMNPDRVSEFELGPRLTELVGRLAWPGMQFERADNYILDRLRADAAHTTALAECEAAIQHAGLRGRLREILIANLLAPWLPPFCNCCTGMVIESKNKPRRSTQDDILVIDTSIAPPVLTNVNGPEGVFLYNSVLLRIEVKSTVTREAVSEFIDASSEIVRMDFDKQPNCKTKFTKPYNILVAFKSDSSSEEWDYEFHRFLDVMKQKALLPPLSGFVSAICVVDKGFWFLKGFSKTERSWYRQDTDTKEDRLAHLVAKASNTAYRAHAERQGRDPSQGLEVGIGSSISGTVFQLPVSGGEEVGESY